MRAHCNTYYYRMVSSACIIHIYRSASTCKAFKIHVHSSNFAYCFKTDNLCIYSSMKTTKCLLILCGILCIQHFLFECVQKVLVSDYLLTRQTRFIKRFFHLFIRHSHSTHNTIFKWHWMRIFPLDFFSWTTTALYVSNLSTGDELQAQW